LPQCLLVMIFFRVVGLDLSGAIAGGTVPLWRAPTVSSAVGALNQSLS
jgi:hypothetical protein